jgi:polyhydroxyalkanoate synthesis regulator phasin
MRQKEDIAMASRNNPVAGPMAAKDVQGVVVVQLEEARRRIQSFEKELVKRGRAHRKELEALIRSVRTGKQLRSLEKQVSAATGEFKRRLDGIQTALLEALGVASRDELRHIHRELARLTRRVDALASKRPSA